MSPTSSTSAGRFIGWLPLILGTLVGFSVFLSGCPSSGVSGDAARFDPDQEGAEAATAPDAVQLRNVDPEGRVVELRFQQPFDPASASQASHYSADGGQVLRRIELLGEDHDCLRLHFDLPLVPGLHTLALQPIDRLEGGRFPASSALELQTDDGRAPRLIEVRLESRPGADNDFLELVFDDEMWVDELTSLAGFRLEAPTGSVVVLDPVHADYQEDLRRLQVDLRGPVGAPFDLRFGDAWRLELPTLRDLGGNLLAEAVRTGFVVGDDRAPEVLSVTQDHDTDPSGRVVRVLIDEAVDQASLVPDAFQCTNGAVVLAIDGDAAAGSVLLTLDRPPTVGIDQLEVDGLSDLAGNTMATTTVPVLGDDGVAPWVAGVAATAEVGHFNDEVVVTFSERLHPGDAVDPALFTLESPPGTPIPLDGVDLSWDADRMETTVRFGGDWAWRAPLATDGRALADLHGDAKGDRFGKATIGLPDLDGDGFGDFAVGAHEFDGAAGSKSGAVDLHSGRTGARLLRIEGLAKGDRFGESLAALPDMDGDGVGDLLVGAPKADPAGLDKAGSLFVVSTADGSVLLRVDGFAPREELGEHVAHAGDLDGDQVPDLMVGLPGADAPGMPDVGEVRVFAGVDGSLLHSWFGETHGAKAGTALVGGADFDGDLVDDIAYGADEADPDGRNKAGSVYLRSGADGSLLFRLDGASADDRFGNALALAGDLDGDQRDDLLIGAWYEGSGNRNRAGAAYLVSGTDGSTLAAIEGQAKKDKFGETVDAGHDFDGDGIGDLLIGASGVDPLGDEDQGALFVYSGADQRLIVTLRSTAEDQCLGERARWAGDLDRDGQADILVAFPRADSVVDDDTGVVRLLSGYATHPYQDAGTPLGLTAVATLSLTVGAVRDLASNPLGDGFRQVLVFGDMTPPQVVDATRNLWIDPSGATVDLRFDEAVDLAASVDFGVTASTGGIELERWLLDQGTVLRLRFDAPFGAGVDSLTLGDLLDPAGNLLVAWTGTVDDAVPAPPTLASGSLLLDPNGQPRLELVFTAPVLASDLADAARWTLTAGGTGIDLGDAVLRHDAAASRLTIDLPTVAALTAGASFRLVGEALRDPHGNLTPSLQLDGFVVAESR